MYRKGFFPPVHNPLRATEKYANPGLIRRLAAIVYDSLLLFGVLILAAVPLLAIPGGLRQAPTVRLAEQGYLLGVCFVYFGWFWTHGGQTLGMKSWRLRLVTASGTVTWGQCARRFAAAALSWACAGLGFAWVLLDRDRLAWHDRLSGTRLAWADGRGGPPSTGAAQQDDRDAEE